MRTIVALLMLTLAACETVTPYVSARHESDPGVSNDASNFVCGGVKAGAQLSVRIGWCNQLNGDLDEAEIDIEYEFRRVR